MRTNWILFGVVVALALGIVVAIGILWAYVHFLGPVSLDPDDWGAFGSVVGGAFTLLGSFATIGTLLFLYLQQHRNDTVVAQQLIALTFEQYLSHRKLFFERLEEQSAAFRNEISFPNPERVYNAMFPNNRPNHCEYQISLGDPNQCKAGDLTDCNVIYASIGHLLGEHHAPEKMIDLALKIVDLQGHLGMTDVSQDTRR